MSRDYWLRSARLGFGRWTTDDLDLAKALWGDDRVTRWIGGPFPAMQVRDRLAQEIAAQAAHGIQYWPTFRLADDAHVGCCGLRPYPGDRTVLEIGFHVRHEHWGQGHAAESARAVIDHAFAARPEIRALFAGHHPENAPSRALLAKLGFRYTHDALYEPTGRRHPSYLLVRP
jgi:ribosomal-protein-alanine N-acetyltransferase